MPCSRARPQRWFQTVRCVESEEISCQRTTENRGNRPGNRGSSIQVHQFVRRKLNMKLKSALADREHQSVLLSWVVADSAGWRVRTRRACVDSELTFS